MVGKSSLTYRFINYETPKEHDPTIEDKYKTNLDVNGQLCEIGNLKNNLRDFGHSGTRRLSRHDRHVDKFRRRDFISVCSK